MLIIDGHLDLAWNALNWNRDLHQSAYTIRTLEAATPGKGRAVGTVAFPELRRGRVALCFATTTCRMTGAPVANIDYHSVEQVYAAGQAHLAYYHALERTGVARILRDVTQLDSHVAQWEAWEQAGADEKQTPPLGFVLSMEGPDPIIEPEQVGEWWDGGIRLMGMTHYGPGRYAGGTGTDVGLTPLGRRLLKAMAQQGVVLDTTHCSDPAFWEALDIFDGPVLASHQNCRALVPHQRQFTDEQIKAVIARDGVLGSAFDVFMLKPGFTVGVTTNEGVTIDTVVAHMDHVCQLAGNSRHAAIGTDLDGGYGREQSPHDLDTIVDLQRIPDLLAKRGYKAEDIASIMHGNWLRLLRRAWDR